MLLKHFYHKHFDQGKELSEAFTGGHKGRISAIIELVYFGLRNPSCNARSKIGFRSNKKVLLGTFTEPNISSSNVDADAHHANLVMQEPSGKFLRYLDKIQYEAIAVERNCELN